MNKFLSTTGRMFFVMLLASFFSVMARAADFDHSVWDGLLKKHVVVIHDGFATQVDYPGFVADQTQLNDYLNRTAAVSKMDFDQWSKSAQLAFLINVYNAQTISLVSRGYPVKSIKDLGSLLQSPWKKPFFSLLGEKRSLDDIEQTMIRHDRYAQPRIHFALNCASIGCPALRAGAYTAELLPEQLDEATRLFLSDRSRNFLVGNTLTLSSIFDWYRGDFERGWDGFKTLPDFLAVYHQALGLSEEQIKKLRAGEIKIDFGDYDWKLNGVFKK